MHIRFGEPRRAGPDINFARGQVFGLNRLEGRYVLFEARVGSAGGVGHEEFFAYIAGKVLVFRFPLVGLGIKKDGSFEFGEKFVLGLIEQNRHVFQIHTRLFVQQDQEGFLRGRDGPHRVFVLNGPFSEDCGFDRFTRFLVVVLQGQEQGQVRVVGKGTLVGTLGDWAKPPNERVIDLIQLSACLCHSLFGAVVHLCAKAGPNGIADLNKPANSLAGLGGKVAQDFQRIAITDGNLAIDDRVGVWLNVIRSRNDLLARRLVNGTLLGLKNALGQLIQLLPPVSQQGCVHRFRASVRSVDTCGQ